MTQVTDAMVDAALSAYRRAPYGNGIQRMRRALEAALAVAPKDEAGWVRDATNDTVKLSGGTFALDPAKVAAVKSVMPCTCHPGEAPVPCQHKYAYADCVTAWETGRNRP